MKKLKITIISFLVLLGLTACFEFRIPQVGPVIPPKIEVGPYQFFLARMSVNFDTLMSFIGDDDSFLGQYREPYPGSEGDWFVLRDTFSTEFDLDMDMQADAIQHSISQKMVFTEFSTQTFSLSNPMRFDEIYDLSMIPEGISFPVNNIAFPKDTSYISFPMDRQRFSSGNLSVTIYNDLVCTLGAPLSVLLYDSLTQVPIRDPMNNHVGLVWSSSIPAGGQASENLSLAGVELPKYVMVEISGVICGDGPETISNSPEARASSFNVSGQITSLVGEFVEGYLDSQFLGDTSVISFGDELNDSEISVLRAMLDTCNVKITMSNTSNISGKILLNVMSLDISDLPGIQFFTTDSMTIPASGSQSYFFTLNNASVELSEDFEYRSYIKIPGQHGQLSSGDEFSIDFSFYGKNPGDPVLVKSVDAAFNNKVFRFDDMSINAGMGELLPEGFEDIELAAIDLTLDILSGISIPMYLDMKLTGMKKNSNETLEISINQQISGAGSNPHIAIDNAKDLFNFRPDSLIFSGEVRLDGSGNIPLTQSLSVNGTIAVPFQFELKQPINFSLGYSSLSLGNDIPSFLDDFRGALEAKVNNRFQFGVDFLVRAAYDTLYFDNPAYSTQVRTLADIGIPALDTTTQILELTKEDFDFLTLAPDSAWLAMDIFLTGRSDGQPTTFLSTDSVTLSLSILAEGTLDLSFPGSENNSEGGE